MGFITCRNYHCKYWFEHVCIKNVKAERVALDESGKCESFKKGTFGIYKLDEKGVMNNE